MDRGGKTYQMSFRRGEPGRFKDTGSKLSPTSVFEPFVENSVLDVVGKAKRGVTGTRIRYWADRQIFTPDAKFAYEDLAARARQTSFLVPGLKLTVRDERRLPGTPGESGPHQEVFHHDGGISEFVDFLAADSGVTDIWRLHGAGKFKETVPVLDENGHSKIAEVERDCEVDIALRWGIGYETTMRSFVNIIATPRVARTRPALSRHS
ncbi:DNA gyrase subunit B [Arthrobacter sp. Hiyo8]|nr:DNA gyrase subunit B [Arthrobacter sp. Hiyo8]